MTLNLQRQSGIIPTPLVRGTSVSIVGCGAIGSHVSETLAKIGIREMKVWDYDKVEDHNLPNQGFRLQDLGKAKVHALGARLKEAVGIDLEMSTDKVTSEEVFDTDIVIAAVDSMSARKEIFEAVKKSEEVELLIDARMGALFGQVYVVDMALDAEIESYEATLFSDADAYQAPCTEKSTIFCAVGLAAWMTSIVTAYLLEELPPRKLEVDFVRMEVMREEKLAVATA